MQSRAKMDDIDAGFIFLDIEHPLVAWECYRGILISPQFIKSVEQYHPSIMIAGIIQAGNNIRLSNELIIESIRAKNYKDEVSRLRCLYIFKDTLSAKKISSWGGHFESETNIVEVEINARKYTKVDANWITHAERSDDGLIIDDYISKLQNYWEGIPYNTEPVWEYLIEGTAKIIGTELRRRAYQTLRSRMPNALGLLEIARISAILNSNLGHVVPYIIRKTAMQFELTYIIDMNDATNKDFLSKLAQYNGVKNHQDLKSFSFTTPDFTEFCMVFSISNSESYL